MKLEAGKTYRTADGNKARCICDDAVSDSERSCICLVMGSDEEIVRSYHSDGSHHYSSGYNIISEWIEPGEGYRLLDPGVDEKRPTDEWWWEAAQEWATVGGNEENTSLHKDKTYRRKIEPTVRYVKREIENIHGCLRADGQTIYGWLGRDDFVGFFYPDGGIRSACVSYGSPSGGFSWTTMDEIDSGNCEPVRPTHVVQRVEVEG